MQYAELTPLKPTLQTDRHTKIATWDTETTDGLHGASLFCSSFCRPTQSGYTVQQSGSDITDFVQILAEVEDELAMSNKNKMIVYVHNLGFDVRFLLDYVLRRHSDFFYVQSGGNVLIFKIGAFPHIKFLDSAQFLQSTQEAAEIEWNIDELYRKIDCTDLFNTDYSTWSQSDKQRVLEHNRNDVLALTQIMQKFRSTMLEIAHVDVCSVNTPASLAMKSLRVHLQAPLLNSTVFRVFDRQTRKWCYRVNQELESFIRKSYFGGRTECFCTNRKQNVRYVDIVSNYPDKMANRRFPGGRPVWLFNHSTIERDIANPSREGFVRAIAHPNNDFYPILPAIENDKLVFSNRTKEGIWCYPEVRYAISRGYSFEFITSASYESIESPYLFFIRKFFEIKSRHSGGRKRSAKLMINSSYGKRGQRFERESTIFRSFPTFEEAFDFEQGTGVINNTPLYQFLAFKKDVSESVKPFQDVGHASYITSYGRLQPLEMANFLLDTYDIRSNYMDTDSLVPDDDSHITFGRELGNWDIEQAFDEFQAFCPKVYIFRQGNELGVKAKGVRRRKLRELLQECSDLDELESALREVIHLEEQYLPILSSLRRNSSALSFERSRKCLTLANTKRIALENGWTRPFSDLDET